MWICCSFVNMRLLHSEVEVKKAVGGAQGVLCSCITGTGADPAALHKALSVSWQNTMQMGSLAKLHS